MFVWQAHSLIAVVRLIGNSNNRRSAVHIGPYTHIGFAFLIACELPVQCIADARLRLHMNYDITF
jgi:hypothetical protein